MGHHLDSIFGNKLSVAGAGVMAFVMAMYNNLMGENSGSIQYIVISVAMLFIGDTLLGSMVARRDKNFSSRGFSRSIEKMFIYALAVVGMTAFGALVSAVPCASGVGVPEEIITTGARIFFVWTMLLVGLTEFISVLENLELLGFKMPKNVGNIIKWMEEKLYESDLIPLKESKDGEGENEDDTGGDREGEEGQNQSP